MATRRPPGLRGGWEHTQPADSGLLTRPAEPWPTARPQPGFQPTRPQEGFQPSQLLDGFAHTRPMDPWQHTRPADLQAARAPARPATVPATPHAATHAATPAAPVLRRPPPAAIATPPSAKGHWQVAGEPGQNLVLMPGQMHVGQHVSSVRTLLGSCVAITLWHPARRIGGMCHFLLPSRTRRAGEPTDGRYGDEAVEAMVATLKTLRTAPEECVAHLYGGADTMSGVSAAKFNIGERNIEQGWTLIDKYGFQLDGVDVGEDIPRMVSLSLGNGSVAMRRGTGSAPDHLRI
jgi:chemotaxis protein CheD